MKYLDKRHEDTTQPVQARPDKSGFQLGDHRTSSVLQRKQADALANKPMPEIVQQKANTTGLPDQLKSGVENLSGHSMDDVKVHYNSSQPAQLNAYAYAQGNQIHLAPGQEKHLPHEAWHVVQQKQGRVKPTMQMKGKVNVNDDKGLEKEADVMGLQALNHTENAPIQNKKSSKKSDVVQTVLNEKDIQALKSFMQARIAQILYMINSAGLASSITSRLAGRCMVILHHIESTAIASFDSLQPALEQINTQLLTNMKQLAFILPTKHHKDKAFLKHQWEFMAPMSAHIQQAKVLGHAMLSHKKTLPYGKTNQTNVWLNDPDVALRIFRKLHQSTQGLLWFANLKQSARKKGDPSFKAADGLDLMNTVGRLSMMISDSDFLPIGDTRPLPHNWTSDKFLDSRATRPGASRELISATKHNLIAARLHHHRTNQSALQNLLDIQAHLPEETSAQDRRKLEAEIQHAREKNEKTNDPGNNDRTDFRYEMDLPTVGRHSTKMFNSGALRLEFSNARKILNKINPGAINEDLSYENIVAYLNHMKGNILQNQSRLVFQQMGAADTFLRELAILLVGIEGSQNNMMMMHGPMVMDLAAQERISYNRGLFTGQRRPTLESMPYFVYAADATQKGTDAGSHGPMERQTDLLRKGSFNSSHLAADARIIRFEAEKTRRMRAQKDYEDEMGEFNKRSKEILGKKKLELELHYQGLIDKDEKVIGLERGSKDYRIAILPYMQQLKSDLRKFTDDLEPPRPPIFAEPNATPDLRDGPSKGYNTFKDVYMRQQFELQKMFLQTFFPQIAVLDFSGSKTNFIAFVQRLMEHYTIYRFLGNEENSDAVHNQWAKHRPKIMSKMEEHNH